jgi:hypothetical protein
MTTYFNQRTGDTVTMDGRSARLDALDNWQTLDGDDETPQLANDGVLSRPTLTAPGVHDPSADVPTTNEELREENPAGTSPALGQELTTTEDGQVSGVDKPPARGASKAEWQDYARKVEDAPERQSDIEGLTKEQLVERYGGGS